MEHEVSGLLAEDRHLRELLVNSMLEAWALRRQLGLAKETPAAEGM